MFAKSIVTSDAFLDMPMSARCLYFTLGMFADDDGFVNNPKSIIRQIGASEDDMKVLLGKKFVLDFESGVIVIKHWRINNYLRSDRYRETNYVEEKSTLSIDKNGAYTEVGIPVGIPYYGETQDSIGKDSIGNNIKKENPRKKIPPTVEMVREYCKSRNNNVNAEQFCDFYECKGWMVGKDKMKDWQAAVRTWERNNVNRDMPEKPMVDEEQVEKGRQAQAEAERKLELEHQKEMEQLKKEHPEWWEKATKCNTLEILQK